MTDLETHGSPCIVLSMATTFVQPKKCPRCDGTGSTPHSYVHGVCFRCSGLGIIEGNRAAIAAAKLRQEQRRQLGHACFEADMFAHIGLSALEANEPERAAKALDSFVAGRTDVVSALAAYGRATALAS